MCWLYSTFNKTTNMGRRVWCLKSISLHQQRNVTQIFTSLTACNSWSIQPHSICFGAPATGQAAVSKLCWVSSNSWLQMIGDSKMVARWSVGHPPSVISCYRVGLTQEASYSPTHNQRSVSSRSLSLTVWISEWNMVQQGWWHLFELLWF